MTEGKKKALFVDDDENLRTVAADKLAATDVEVATAADGAAGLAKALEWHPDIVFLDIMMPVMDGWQVLDKLRADAWGKTARVVMLTSLDGETEIARALEHGIHEYVAKNKLDLDDLVKMVVAPPVGP